MNLPSLSNSGSSYGTLKILAIFSLSYSIFRRSRLGDILKIESFNTWIHFLVWFISSHGYSRSGMMMAKVCSKSSGVRIFGIISTPISSSLMIHTLILDIIVSSPMSWSLLTSSPYSLMSLIYKYELSNRLKSLPNSSNICNSCGECLINGLFKDLIRDLFPAPLSPKSNKLACLISPRARTFLNSWVQRF